MNGPPAGASGAKTDGAFLVSPAVVSAGNADVDFLEIPLPHVRNEQPVGSAWAFVEAKSPRIAQAIAKDFLTHSTARADERIARGNPVLPAGSIGALWIDAQDFSEQIREVLRIPERIGGARTVAAGVTGVVVIRTPAVAG